jgi:hypothetical protein
MASRNSTHPARWYALIAVHAYVVILSNSRTPLLDLLIGLIVLALLYRRSVRLILLGTGVFVGLAWFAGDAVIAGLSRGQSSTQIMELSGRVAVWEAALNGWTEHMWLGAGYGHGTMERINNALDASYTISTADSTPIDALTQTGVIGASLVVLFLLTGVALIVRLGRLFGNPSARRPEIAVAAATVAAMILHSLSSGGAGRFHIFALFLAVGTTVLWTALPDRSTLQGTPASTRRSDRAGRLS